MGECRGAFQFLNNDGGHSGEANLGLEFRSHVCHIPTALRAPVMQYGSCDPVYFGHWSEFIALFMFLAACIKHSQSTGCVAPEAQRPLLSGPRDIPSWPARWPRNEKSYISCHPNTHPAVPAGPHAEAAAVRVVPIAHKPSNRQKSPPQRNLFLRRFWAF